MKCPTCFAAFPKTSSLYEFCQTDKDCFSPVKQLLPFWGNYNNNKTWNVQNRLALERMSRLGSSFQTETAATALISV